MKLNLCGLFPLSLLLPSSIIYRPLIHHHHHQQHQHQHPSNYIVLSPLDETSKIPLICCFLESENVWLSEEVGTRERGKGGNTNNTCKQTTMRKELEVEEEEL